MRKCDTFRWLFTMPIVAMSAVDARADWLVSDFATPTTDSAQTRSLYGIRAVANPSSVTKVLVKSDTGGNFLRLNASKIASEGASGYSAEVGVVLPFDAQAKERDLAGLMAIRFEYRISTPVTENLAVSLESGVYSESAVRNRTVFEGHLDWGRPLAKVGEWIPATLDLQDFSTPSWWTPPADFPTLEEVLSAAYALRFEPRTSYGLDGSYGGSACVKCVGPTMASQILDIRKVTLVGYPLGRIDTLPTEPVDTQVVVVPPPPPPMPSDTVGYLLSDYAVVALDSAKTNAVYGIRSEANPASRATASVPGGYLRLDAPLIASEPDYQGHSANVGLIHPIFPDGHAVDLSSMTTLSFEFRHTDKITDRFLVTLGSNTYTQEQRKAGTIYEMALTGYSHLQPGTNWRRTEIDVRDFSTPTWWTAPADFPTIDSVLRHVHSLRFAPQSKYTNDGVEGGKACYKCVGPDMTRQTLEIRNIRLKDVYFPKPAGGDTLKDLCSGSKVIALDDFQDGDNRNLLGGSWFSYSDADAGWLQSEEEWGSSTAHPSIGPGAITLDASLNKKVGDVWHSRAGWAGLETVFGEGIDLEGLVGIQFGITTQLLDPNAELSLKVYEQNVPEGGQLSVPLKAGATSICVTPQDLKPPKGSSRSSALDGSNLLRIAWEARIPDQTHPFIDQAKARFTLQNVKLFGVDPDRVSKSLRRAGQKSFAVSYSHGALLLEGLEGLGQVEIRDLKGRAVASFAAASRVPLRLGNGTYILAARRGTAPVVRSFIVTGR